MKSLQDRIILHKNPTAIKLLNIMITKQTNLSIAADVTLSSQLLNIADSLGPYICVFKTHIDILSDYTPQVSTALSNLALKHNFLIFEDRKFADIGNTVALQYSTGVYNIASWSHITNAHPLPGPGIIQGLQKIGLPLGRGLLLLAEMSSKGCLITPEYSNQTMDMALLYSDFCIGFIGQSKLSNPNPNVDFIYMTPGVQLQVNEDALGQQYRTPRNVILDCDCDIIIVGRGIYEHQDMVSKAKEYQKAGWDAYLEKIYK